MRAFALFNAWLMTVGAAIHLLRLASPKNWPVVLKFEQWEYALKTFYFAVLAVWGFWVIYK